MRKRLLIIWLVILFSPVILLCLFLLFERVRGQISVARFKRGLTAKGETLDVQKLIATPVAGADNGATEVIRLKALLQEGKVIPKKLPAEDEVAFSWKGDCGLPGEFLG
jgi:hypothetical protein